MRVTRLRRLLDRAAGEIEAREGDRPRVRVFLPWNGSDPPPGEYGGVVIYRDPDVPPPETRNELASPNSC